MTTEQDERAPAGDGAAPGAMAPGVSPDDYRKALGSFLTGVTIITSRDGERPVGTTVSAFSALSLDPPLVLVCLANTSNTLKHAEAAGFFAVNILSAGQGEIAMRFASSRITDKFENVNFCAGETGAPLIDGASATIDCVLEQAVPGGDHTILIGRARSSGINSEVAPLAYFRGAFVEIGSSHADG